MNLTYTTIRELPKITTNMTEIAQREFAIEFWRKEYAQASLQKADAWKLYDDAIERGEARDMIAELYVLATMFTDIADDTWRQWDNAKAKLLELFN